MDGFHEIRPSFLASRFIEHHLELPFDSHTKSVYTPYMVMRDRLTR